MHHVLKCAEQRSSIIPINQHTVKHKHPLHYRHVAYGDIKHLGEIALFSLLENPRQSGTNLYHVVVVAAFYGHLDLIKLVCSDFRIDESTKEIHKTILSSDK